MKRVIKHNLLGIMVAIMVFAGFYVSFVLGQRSVRPARSGMSRSKRIIKTSAHRSSQTKAKSSRKPQDDAESTFYGTATVVAASKVQSEQGGKIVYLKYKEGDRVKQNEVVVRFDTTKLDLQRRKTHSEQKAAEEQLKEALLNYDICKKNNDRALKLYSRRAISSQELEQSKNALRLAQTALRKGREALEQVKVTLKLLQEQRKACEVSASINGIVHERFYNLNEIYKAGDTIYHLVNLDHIDVAVKVSENYLPRVRLGQKAHVMFAALAQKYVGVVAKMPTGSSQDSYNFTVQVRVANVQHQIRPGMFAKIVFLPQ